MLNTKPWISRMSASTFCLLCGTGWFWAVEPPQDPLWRKAVAVCSTNGDWLAGLVVMRSEVLYKGQSAGVHELWERCSLGRNGEVLTETIKVLEDGKDTTPKEKSKSKAKQDTKKSANPGGGNPFDPKVQNQVTAKLTGRSKVLDGKNCVAYEFELKASNALVFRGTAWLETDTGRPIETENMSLNP